jgi:OOP family OmpA-OmpF porin
MVRDVARVVSVAALSMAALFVAVAHPVRADLYVGAHLGRTATSSEIVDDSDSAFGATAGWLVNDYVGVEVGYSDLGRFASPAWAFEAEAVRVAAVVRLPFGHWSLFGRMGGADLRIDGVLGGSQFEDSEIESFGGVGLVYRFERFALSLEWSQYNNARNDLQVTAVGFLWFF